jgi:hypothetical protein
MNAQIILAGAKLVGMVLSFALLLRARRLSRGLWATEPSNQRLHAGGDVE